MLRILLAICFMFVIFGEGFLAKLIALGLFVAASLTDILDGMLARRFNIKTALGEFMDPIADKILTFAAFISFVEMGILPAWMILMIFTREVLITGLRIFGLSRGVPVGAGRSGKHKTFLQFAAIICVLIFLILKETTLWDPAWTGAAMGTIYYFMLWVVVVTLASGVRYAIKNWQTLMEH